MVNPSLKVAAFPVLLKGLVSFGPPKLLWHFYIITDLIVGAKPLCPRAEKPAMSSLADALCLNATGSGERRPHRSINCLEDIQFHLSLGGEPLRR